MADLESVIANAVADAGGGESVDAGGSETPETPETPETDTSADTSGTETAETFEPEGVKDGANPDKEPDAEPVVEEAAETAEKPAEAKPAEKDQLTKDLEELGLKAPKEGERENRLPHSRVRKIAENYGKKVEARFTGEITTLKEQVTKLSRTAQSVENIDRLIASGEAGVDRLMTLFNTLHPGKFDKYLGNAKAAVPAKEPAKAAASTLGPRPQPDVQFEDGSRGYKPETHEKLLEWIAADAKEKAKAEAIEELETRMEAKYGKMAERYEADEALSAQIPKVKEVVADVNRIWGKELVDKHEAEIVAFMEAHPEMSTKEAVAEVLLPKVRAERNTMRNDLINETKKRTAAAAKIVPGPRTAGKEDSGPKSLEDVIRNSVASLKR